MPHLYCLVILLAGIYTVYTYPFMEPTYYADDYEALGLPESVYEREPLTYLSPYNPYSDLIRKRGERKVQKRSDINRLIRRLIALYGNNDIEYSGRSTGLRFGPGGR